MPTGVSAGKKNRRTLDRTPNLQCTYSIFYAEQAAPKCSLISRALEPAPFKQRGESHGREAVAVRVEYRVRTIVVFLSVAAGVRAAAADPQLGFLRDRRRDRRERSGRAAYAFAARGACEPDTRRVDDRIAVDHRIQHEHPGA